MEDLPTTVQEFYTKNDQTTERNDDGNKAASEKENGEEEYHKLSIDQSRIVVVTRREEFYEMLEYLSHQLIVAFDAEWKPISFVTTEVALIQLATHEFIYLIDVVLLKLSLGDWNNLASFIFNNTEILKLCESSKVYRVESELLKFENSILGFSPLIDLKMFQKLMPFMSLSTQTLTSYLDLQAFSQKLAKTPRFRFPFSGRWLL